MDVIEERLLLLQITSLGDFSNIKNDNVDGNIWYQISSPGLCKVMITNFTNNVAV